MLTAFCITYWYANTRGRVCKLRRWWCCFFFHYHFYYFLFRLSRHHLISSHLISSNLTSSLTHSFQFLVFLSIRFNNSPHYSLHFLSLSLSRPSNIWMQGQNLVTRRLASTWTRPEQTRWALSSSSSASLFLRLSRKLWLVCNVCLWVCVCLRRDRVIPMHTAFIVALDLAAKLKSTAACSKKSIRSTQYRTHAHLVHTCIHLIRTCTVQNCTHTSSRAVTVYPRNYRERAKEQASEWEKE